MALLVNSELNNVKDVWDEIESVFETDGEVSGCSLLSEEFHIGGVISFFEAPAILIAAL